MRNKLRGLTAATLLLPAASMAENLSYNYLEGGLAFHPDFESQGFIGPDTRGSIALHENIFALGGLKFLTDDGDLTALPVGGGGRYGLDARTDIWGGVTLEHQEIEWDHGDVDDSGLGFRAGIRHQLNSDLELGIGGGLLPATWTTWVSPVPPVTPLSRISSCLRNWTFTTVSRAYWVA